MSISYTLKKIDNMMTLYDDFLCPVMSDNIDGHILEMNCLELYEPDDMEREVGLLDAIYQQALVQNDEIAEIMSSNLGMRNCDFSIETDNMHFVFSRESFKIWRHLNKLAPYQPD